MKLYNLCLTYPNCNPITIPTTRPSAIILTIYLSLAPAYRHMTSATSPSTSTDPISGMSNNTRNKTALSAANEMKNSRVFTNERLRISHHAKNITYPNLKNSTGWIVVLIPIFLRSSRPVAPFRSIPSGVNTNNCMISDPTPMMITTRSCCNILKGSLYTIQPKTNPNPK